MKPNETTSKMEEEQAKASVLNSEISVIERDKVHQGTSTFNFLFKVTNGKSSEEDQPRNLISESCLLVSDPQPGKLESDAMSSKVLLSSGDSQLESIHSDTSSAKSTDHVKDVDLKHRPQSDDSRIGMSFPETSDLCEKKTKSEQKTLDEVLDCEEIQQTRKILVATERRQDLGQNSNKSDPSKHKKSPTPKTGQENASDNNVDSNSVGSSSSEVKRPDRKCKNLTKALMMLTYSDDYVFYDDSSVTRISNYHKECKATSKRNQTKEPKKEKDGTTEQLKPRSQDFAVAEGGRGKRSDSTGGSKVTTRETENANEETELTEHPELQQQSLPKNKIKGLKKRGRRRSTVPIKKNTIKPMKKIKTASCEVSSKTESHTTVSQTTPGNAHRKLEDCLPDVVEPRSSRQPSRRSLEAEKCSAIIEHVIEGDRHFCCFSCLKYFASFHQFSDHKNSLVCVPGLLASTDQKSSNDVANHGSILTCNSYNACKSKTNRFDDTCDSEYSKFTSDAPGRIPEVTFNGMHGKLDHIESMDAQIFRSKLNLNDTEKYKMNINSPWTTKEVWESGGGWELSGKDYLSWHKYENRWSESRRFLMSMSHLPWSEQIKFKKVFDLTVSTKPLKKQMEDMASSEGLLKKFPGKKKHNSLIGAIGLRQTSKSAKYMSVNEREELRQKAMRQELVDQQPEDINISRSNLNGEWERDHFFICGACSEHFDDLGKAMSHKWDAHPYCLVAHVICQSELSEPPSGFTYPQTGRQLAPDRGVLVLPKRTSSNYARKAAHSQSIKCTKCQETNFGDRNAFRIHILECGGLINWNNPTTKKKKRSKRAKNTGNSKMIKRTHSRDGTESDDSSGTNNFNQAAALKRKQRFERFNQPPPMRDVGVGRFTRLQAVRVKSTSKRGRRRKIDVKQDMRRAKNESDVTSNLIKPDSILKCDEPKAKRLKMKRTHLVATPRPRRSVGNYTYPPVMETGGIKVETSPTEEKWKPIPMSEKISTSNAITVKEQESFKTAKALMSDMLEKVEKAVQVVKKAEELNLSIDSVRGKIAEFGSDRNRKRKSSVPTRLIFKTDDEPVISKSFVKDESISVEHISSDDDQMKPRSNENEEKLPKVNAPISQPDSETTQPDSETIHPSLTPAVMPSTNDENVQPPNCREEADAERAKLEFVKDYLSRVALVQAITKQMMMRDTMSPSASPTVASFIEARRSLLNNAAHQNFKTLTNKTQPDTQALIQTAQAQALFKAQMSNLYKPMGSAAYEAYNHSMPGDDNRKNTSMPSATHLQPQTHVEPPSSLTGVLKRLQKPSLVETLQAKDSSSSMQSLPTILTHQIKSRDSKASSNILSKDNPTKTENIASSSLQSPRSLETHSDMALSAVPKQPVDVHGVFSAAYSPLQKTDFHISRSSPIKDMPDTSPLSLLLMGRKNSVVPGTSPSSDFQLGSINLQVDCQPEDLSMKKKPFDEKKYVQDKYDKHSQNFNDPHSANINSSNDTSHKPDTVRIIRVTKDGQKSKSSSYSSSNELSDSPLEPKKETQNFNKFEEYKRSKEHPSQKSEEKIQPSKSDEHGQKIELAEILKKTMASIKESSQKPKFSESVQNQHKDAISSQLKENHLDISEKSKEKLPATQSPKTKKLNDKVEEKSGKNQKHPSQKWESCKEEQPVKKQFSLKSPLKEQDTPVKKSPDTHEYDFKDEDSVSIEPMKRSVGRPAGSVVAKRKEAQSSTGSAEKSSIFKNHQGSSADRPLQVEKQHELVLSEYENARTLNVKVDETSSATPDIEKKVNSEPSPRKKEKLPAKKEEDKITSNHLNGFKMDEDITNAKKEKIAKSPEKCVAVLEINLEPQAPTVRKRGRPPKQKVNSDPSPNISLAQISKKADVFDFQIDEDDDWSDSFRRPKKSLTTGSPPSPSKPSNFIIKDEEVIQTLKQEHQEPEEKEQSTSPQGAIEESIIDEHQNNLIQDCQNESLSASRSSSHDDFDPEEDDFKPSSNRRRSSFANSFYALMPMRKTLRRTAARISMERANEREALMNVLFDESDQSNDAEVETSHSEKPTDDELFNKLLNPPESRIGSRGNDKSEDVISKSNKGQNGTPSTKEKKKRGRKPLHLSGKNGTKEQSQSKPDPFDELVTSSKPAKHDFQPAKDQKLLDQFNESNKLSKHSPRQKRKRYSSTPSTSLTSKKRNSSSYDDIAIYQAGLSVSEISKLTGIPEELLDLDRPKRSRRSVPVETDANRTIYPLEVRSFAVDRIRSGVTQVQVARDLDCPVSTVASWWHKRKQIKLALDPNAVLSDSDDDSDILPLKTKRSYSTADGTSMDQKSKPGYKSKQKRSSKKAGQKQQAILASMLKKKGTTKRQKSFSASASSIESYHTASDEVIDDDPASSSISEAKSSKVNLESKAPSKATATDGTESEDTDDDDDRGSAATVGIKNQILKHCFASMAARNNQ